MLCCVLGGDVVYLATAVLCKDNSKVYSSKSRRKSREVSSEADKTGEVDRKVVVSFSTSGVDVTAISRRQR